MRNVKRIFQMILAVLLIFAILITGLTGFYFLRQKQVLAQVKNENETSISSLQKLPEIGETTQLEILPLVENAVADSSLESEHGVSYLLRTDDAVILMDFGMNLGKENPSLLEKNMQHLGVSLNDVDIVVISHNHPDHVGGISWWRQGTFSPGAYQTSMEGKAVFVPVALNYPGIQPEVSSQPMRIANGVATLGVLSFPEVFGVSLMPAVGYEQVLAVNVKGIGLVLVTGCGHPGLPAIIQRAQTLFDQPVAGVIGGLHYGDAQPAQLEEDIQLLKSLPIQVVGLSPHDSSASVIQVFEDHFGAVYQDIAVGKAVTVPCSQVVQTGE